MLVNEWVEDGFRTCHWRHRYPIVPYLIAISVTDYAIYSDWVPFENDSIEVLNYVFPSQLGVVQGQTPNLIPIMQLFNDLFEPYPFILERYGHAQFGWGGGMEHQTMSFMGNFGHELMAHELAHSWFGNKITLGSWEDIWINEGFATYFTGLTYEHMFDGFYWMPWKQQNINWVTSQPGGSVYVDDTTSVSRIFNSRLSYSKGALILHTLRWIIGDEPFYQAIQNILAHPDHAYGFIRTTDVIEFFEQASGHDLTYYFDQWYYGQGYPSYIIQYQTFAESQATVTLHQSQSHSSVDFFSLPVPIRLSGQGNDTIIVLDNTYNGQSFTVDPGFVPELMVFDPDRWLISRNNQLIIGVEEIEADSQVQVFPNPATDVIFIESQLPVEAVTFIAADGKTSRAKNFHQSHGQLYQVDVKSLDAGLWVVRVQVGEQVVHKKVMISR
jgi:aminopeptidase N